MLTTDLTGAELRIGDKIRVDGLREGRVISALFTGRVIGLDPLRIEWDDGVISTGLTLGAHRPHLGRGGPGGAELDAKNMNADIVTAHTAKPAARIDALAVAAAAQLGTRPGLKK